VLGQRLFICGQVSWVRQRGVWSFFRQTAHHNDCLGIAPTRYLAGYGLPRKFRSRRQRGRLTRTWRSRPAVRPGGNQGILGSLRCSSTRAASRRLSSNQGALDDLRGAVSQIRKLSNKLSTNNWAHSANHHLARQVHHRHVLTLWGTTGWCSRRESNPEPWD
jgi:hypothetical protein